MQYDCGQDRAEVIAWCSREMSMALQSFGRVKKGLGERSKFIEDCKFCLNLIFQCGELTKIRQAVQNW